MRLILSNINRLHHGKTILDAELLALVLHFRIRSAPSLCAPLDHVLHRVHVFPGNFTSHRRYTFNHSGMVILELICLIGFISPEIYLIRLGQLSQYNVASIVIGLSAIWLIVFLALDVRDIVKSSTKFNDKLPLKNLFVIFVIGYVVLEGALIETAVINGSSLVFGLLVYSLTLCFSLIIGELLLKYASNEKFQQISANTLAFTGYLAVLYGALALGKLSPEAKQTLATVGAILLGVGQTVSYVLRSRKIMRFIN